MAQRDHVLPEDVQALFRAVIEHRVLLSSEAQLARHPAATVLTDLLAGVPVPVRAG